MVQHEAPGLGEVDATPQLFEEGEAGGILQLLHLHGDGRLGEVELLGGPGKGEVAGHGLKDPELAESNPAHVVSYKVYLIPTIIIIEFS
jgi:hypothetical protein